MGFIRRINGRRMLSQYSYATNTISLARNFKPTSWTSPLRPYKCGNRASHIDIQNAGNLLDFLLPNEPPNFEITPFHFPKSCRNDSGVGIIRCSNKVWLSISHRALAMASAFVLRQESDSLTTKLPFEQWHHIQCLTNSNKMMGTES